MFFDWYSATVPESADSVIPTFLDSFDLSSFRQIKPRNSYSHAVEIHRGDVSIAKLFWGGVNGSDVHVQASGGQANRVAQMVRHWWPAHRVARADVAEDYTAAGAFEVLSAVCLSVADEFNVKVAQHGDWHRNRDGRTLYIGSRQSVVFLRVYEKGKQLGKDPDWTRVEFEIKPNSRQKGMLATMAPTEMLGLSRWATAVQENLSRGTGIEPVRRAYQVKTDLSKALDWMLRQYGPTLEQVARELGGFGALGPFLESQLQERKDAIAQVRAIAETREHVNAKTQH